MLDRKVLPDPYDLPPAAQEGSVGKAITLHISPELRSPVPLVVRGQAPMSWADVPEAAIYEDCDLRSREYQIGADASPREVQTMILTKSAAAPMQERSKGHFRLSVGASDGREVPGPALSERSRPAQTGWGSCFAGGHVPKLARGCWACLPSCGKMAAMAPASAPSDHMNLRERS